MNISLITATGSRKYAFSLCEKYISNQTFKDNIQWIVVDDGEIPTQMNLNQEYIRSDIIWKEGLNTQAYNLLLGLEKVKNDVLFFIEDDDWYSSNFIQNIIDFLLKIKNPQIVGEANSLNYNLLTNQYYLCEMPSMASLYKTCITKDVYPFLRKLLLFYHENNSKLINNQIFIDEMLWSQNINTFNKHLINNNNLAIGIKNMPGRKGVCGHVDDYSNYIKYLNSKNSGIDNKSLDFLKNTIKNDYLNYINI
jgi:hypothetical protein